MRRPEKPPKGWDEAQIGQNDQQEYADGRIREFGEKRTKFQ